MCDVIDGAPFPALRAAYMRAIARAWRDPAYAEALSQAAKEEPKGSLGLLERDYNFQFPFDVTFNVDVDEQRRPRWRPVGTRGWYGFMDRFQVCLPAKPKDAATEAAVLARYCAEFPSLLGVGKDGTVAPPDFANFGVITARVLALAWNDRAFHEKLYAADDARELVQGAMNCVVPWNFQLKFEEKKGASSDADAYWRPESFPRSVITVYLPMRPDGMGAEAIALAAYNDSGGTYPFTCN
jgi:ribosomally synthesized peptide (two-chain TOMM family)